jgi:hypothetical protein
MTMDLREFIAQFQDHLAPKLDTYEQAIYLYVFRHSRLLGLEQVTLGFKSARSRLARGAGEKGKPMSLCTAYSKLASLQAKGCIDILRTTDAGHELRLHIPSEIAGLITPTDAIFEPRRPANSSRKYNSPARTRRR